MLHRYAALTLSLSIGCGGVFGGGWSGLLGRHRNLFLCLLVFLSDQCKLIRQYRASDVHAIFSNYVFSGDTSIYGVCIVTSY